MSENNIVCTEPYSWTEDPVNTSSTIVDDSAVSLCEPFTTTTLTVTSTTSTVSDPEEWTLVEPREEISERFEREDYEIIDISSFLNEIEGMNDNRWERVKDLMITCTSCIEKYFFKTILRRSQYTCPNCDNKLFGIEKNQRYRLVKEILIGEGMNEEMKE